MNDWEKYEYLLIDKMDDFHYFKSLEDISKYLGFTKSKVYSIHFWCKMTYKRQKKSGLFIQRLYNNKLLRPVSNDIFIWDEYQRELHRKAVAYKNYYQLNNFGNN